MRSIIEALKIDYARISHALHNVTFWDQEFYVVDYVIKLELSLNKNLVVSIVLSFCVNVMITLLPERVSNLISNVA